VRVCVCVCMCVCVCVRVQHLLRVCMCLLGYLRLSPIPSHILGILHVRPTPSHISVPSAFSAVSSSSPQMKYESPKYEDQDVEAHLSKAFDEALDWANSETMYANDLYCDTHVTLWSHHHERCIHTAATLLFAHHLKRLIGLPV
jgi:hypothetical protein